MSTQYLSTSRLANVVQLITLGRQTGMLRVIRGQGPSREMGQIQFVDGKPIAALLGTLVGPAALNVLSNWGESYYLFEDGDLAEDGTLDPREADPGTSAYGMWPSGDPGWAQRSSPSQAPSSGSWPSYGGGQSSYGSHPTGSNPGLGGSSQPGYGSYPSGPQPAMPGAVPGTMSGTLGHLPRRITRVEMADPLPLDRRERMVLLLVDGRRSVPDLARLTRRNEDEVRAILGNLKMLGLIE